MKNIYIGCIIIFVVVFIIVLLFFTCMRTYSTNIGNVLSDYMYRRHSGIETYYKIKTSDSDLTEFFDGIIKNDTDKIVEHDFAKTGDIGDSDKWRPLGRKDFLFFWKSIRNDIKNTYDKTIPDKYKNVKYPVLHFRCSDIPFVRHDGYHIPKISSVKWVINILKDKNYSKIIWLNCKSHTHVMKINNTLCDSINNIYIEEFKKSGIEVILQCDTILKDFYTMVYSPLLISLNSSSFSFMAGISKNPENYISCNMGREINGEYELQKQDEADWYLNMEEPVLHKNIKNYFDMEEIKRAVYN